MKFNNDTLDPMIANRTGIIYNKIAGLLTASFRASNTFNNSEWFCLFCYQPCQDPSQYLCSGEALLKVQGKEFLATSSANRSVCSEFPVVSVKRSPHKIF